jgi:hypothetical protein
MPDFTTIKSQFNSTSTDAGAPTWNDITFGGSAGANEYRFTSAGGGAAGTSSALWPQFSRPGATAAVPEAWGFSADTTGIKVGTYTGTNANARQFRINYDNVGTFAAAPTFSAFGDNTHAAPSAGTQPGAQAGSPIVNGQNPDTLNTNVYSYLKANVYGTDAPTGSDPAAGTTGTVTVTSGTLGSVSPGLGAWLANWQSMQGAITLITHDRTPAAVTAGNIWFVLALFTGPGMSLGTLTPVLTFTYSFV